MVSRISFRVLMVLAVLLGGAPSAAQAPSATGYKVNVLVLEGDRIIGAPELTVMPGQPALTSVDKDGGYSLKVVIDPDDRALTSRAKLNAEVYLKKNGRWSQVASPALTMPLGEVSVLDIPASRRVDGQRSSFRFKASVVPTALKSAALGKACTDAMMVSWKSAMDNQSELPIFQSQYTPPTVGDGSCCDTGCVRCCGNRVCCSDSHNCPAGGCCTG